MKENFTLETKIKFLILKINNKIKAINLAKEYKYFQQSNIITKGNFLKIKKAVRVSCLMG